LNPSHGDTFAGYLWTKRGYRPSVGHQAPGRKKLPPNGNPKPPAKIKTAVNGNAIIHGKGAGSTTDTMMGGEGSIRINSKKIDSSWFRKVRRNCVIDERILKKEGNDGEAAFLLKGERRILTAEARVTGEKRD